MTEAESGGQNTQIDFVPEDRIWRGKPFYMSNIYKWSLYDLGNTIFSLVVVSLTIGPLLYILLFDQLKGNYAPNKAGEIAVNTGNFALAIGVAIGNIVMAIISPYVGAIADSRKEKKRLLMKITWLCVIFMAALGISLYVKNIYIIIGIFLIANFFYQIGLVVYDTTLPFVADQFDIGKIASIGIAIGYFGSLIGLALTYALIPFFGDYHAQAATFKLVNGVEQLVTPDNFKIGYIPYIYPIGALMFLLFALPMYTVKEKRLKKAEVKSSFKETLEGVVATGKDIWHYKQMKRFLLGWLIFVDAANTTILFMAQIVLVGLEFGSGIFTSITLGVGIISAVLFTYPVGIFADKYGPKKALYLVTSLWVISVILAFMTNISHTTATQLNLFSTTDWLRIGGGTNGFSALIIIFPIILGPALGGTWVVQRHFITELAPPDKVGNYFGFSNIFGRISAAVGPAIFAFAVYVFSIGWLGFDVGVATRLSLLVIIGLMITGFSILATVDDVHKHFISGARANGLGQWIHNNIVVFPDLKKQHLDEKE